MVGVRGAVIGTIIGDGTTDIIGHIIGAASMDICGMIPGTTPISMAIIPVGIIITVIMASIRDLVNPVGKSLAHAPMRIRVTQP